MEEMAVLRFLHLQLLYLQYRQLPSGVGGDAAWVLADSELCDGWDVLIERPWRRLRCDSRREQDDS
jgi:hypothetical protein